MKKLLYPLLFVGFVLMSSLVYSQTKHTPEQKAEKMTEWMKTNLGLTDEQLPKVQALNLEYAKMNAELKAAATSQDDKMTQMKKHQEEKDAKLKTILTADQYKTYEAKKADMKEEMKKKSDGGSGVKNG
jgi:hypothetical protein